LTFSEQTIEVLKPLCESVAQAMQDALTAIAREDCQLAQEVIGRKPRIKEMVSEANAHLAQRLMTDEPKRVEVFRVESDIISQFNRLYSYARRIAKVVAQGTADRGTHVDEAI
jgi:phosphate:Na+ symporter